jgi:hypothetical protein
VRARDQAVGGPCICALHPAQRAAAGRRLRRVRRRSWPRSRCCARSTALVSARCRRRRRETRRIAVELFVAHLLPCLLAAPTENFPQRNQAGRPLALVKAPVRSRSCACLRAAIGPAGAAVSTSLSLAAMAAALGAPRSGGRAWRSGSVCSGAAPVRPLPFPPPAAASAADAPRGGRSRSRSRPWLRLGFLSLWK